MSFAFQAGVAELKITRTLSCEFWPVVDFIVREFFVLKKPCHQNYFIRDLILLGLTPDSIQLNETTTKTIA